jgi:hypothetical protein
MISCFYIRGLCNKTFYDRKLRKGRVFAPGKPFQLRLFMGKARSLP